MEKRALEHRVLVVDDERAIRKLLQKMLEAEGFDVDTAADGRQALEILDEACPDLLVTDIRMPDIDGLQLLREVRKRDLDLPVIVVTGEDSQELADEVVRWGAFGYLRKPLEVPQLASLARRAVGLVGLARAKRHARGDRTTSWMGDTAGAEALFERGMASLRMALQPIVDAESAEVRGYEAFLRTQEPGISGPWEFIRIAQHLGRSQELESAIRLAIKSALETDLSPAVDVHVNVTSSELFASEGEFEHSVLAAFAHRIVLEVSDRDDFDKEPSLHLRIDCIKQAGFRIALDNLGAGHASLQVLAALRPDAVKIDRSLVCGLASNDDYRWPIVDSIISQCRSLDIQTIAQGIETRGERDALLRLSCPVQQGYLYGMPD